MHRSAHGEPTKATDIPGPLELRDAQRLTNQLMFALWVEDRDELERMTEHCTPEEIRLLKSSIRHGQLQQQS